MMTHGGAVVTLWEVRAELMNRAARMQAIGLVRFPIRAREGK